jgi:uncharacterized protein (TIGR02268 family)
MHSMGCYPWHLLEAHLRALILVVLVAALPLRATASQPAPVSLEMKRQRIVLGDEAGERVPDVRLAPGYGTTLYFDAALARDSLTLDGGKERFERVSVTEREIILQPRPGLTPGTQVTLEVRFADGQAPARARLVLVIHAREVDTQVDVHRRSLPAEVLQAELHALRGRCAATEAGLAALRARCEAGGLAGLIFLGVLGPEGVTATVIQERPQERDIESPPLVRLYRSQKWRALVVPVRSPRGLPAWEPGTARLARLGRDGAPQGEPLVVPVQMEGRRLAPGEEGRVVVQWEEPEGWEGAEVSLVILDVDGRRSLRWEHLKP